MRVVIQTARAFKDKYVSASSGPSIRYIEQVSLFALLISLVAFSIDAMLPALAHIEKDLGVTDPNDRQYVIGMLFIGLSLGMLIFGPLSDSLGRKRPMYVGILIFVCGTLLSLFSQDFTTMLAGRFMQGFGLAGPRVISIAMVRDQYAGNVMARFMSFVMTVFILVPVLAPAIGQIILMMGNWRMIFAFMLILSLIAFVWFSQRQTETLAKSDRMRFSMNRFFIAAKEVFTNRVSFGYMAMSGLAFSAFICYLSISQQIFQEQYGTGDLFPIYFGVTALAIGAASFVNSQLVMKWGMSKLILLALWCSTFLSAIFTIATIFYTGHPPLWSLMLYLILNFFCFGILFGNLNAQAMEPLGHIAGVASAVISSVTTLVSVAIGTGIAQLYSGDILPLIISFTVFGGLSIGLMGWTHRKKRVYAS